MPSLNRKKGHNHSENETKNICTFLYGDWRTVQLFNKLYVEHLHNLALKPYKCQQINPCSDLGNNHIYIFTFHI
jgi:hypothetical protein